MPKFEKEILTPGLYAVSDANGNRHAKVITKDMISHWVKQHNEMRKSGLNIPAPAYHDKDAIPVGKPASSKDNFGFWEELKQDDTGKLIGVLDVPLESDAERIGKTVKETSIFAVPKFVDGLGREWNNVITHIACCTQPIEPGQNNFKPANNELAIAMSHRIISMAVDDFASTLTGNVNDLEDNAQGSDSVQKPVNTTDVFVLLEKVAKIKLPPNISDGDFREALVAALLQKQLSEGNNSNGGTVLKPPPKSEISEVPVVMSVNQQNGGTQVQPNLVDVETVMSHPAFKSLQSQNQGMLSVLANNLKQDLKGRVARLRQRNVINDEVKSGYEQEIETIQMSFDGNGGIVSPLVQSKIEALESVIVPAPSINPLIAMANEVNGQLQVESNKALTGGMVDDNRADEIVNGLLGKL
jgi:hypothetical protein